MSIIGTGAAAGVAQSALQSQEVARSRDKRLDQDAERAQRLRDAFESQLHQVEQGEGPDAPTALADDSHGSGGQQPDQGESEATAEPAADTAGAKTQPTAEAASPLKRPARRDPLYRHLDVQA